MFTRTIYRLLLPSVVLALAACATAQPVPMGNDSYIISQTSAGGIFRSMSSIKTEVISRANAFAASKGKVAVPLAGKESPAYPGHMPSFEYQFRLVDKEDPRAQGNALLPRPDAVVEMHPSPTSSGNPSTASSELYNNLIKLDDLRKRGIISEDEFKAEKQKLLSGS